VIGTKPGRLKGEIMGTVYRKTFAKPLPNEAETFDTATVLAEYPELDVIRKRNP
jgi:hypothetical protein